MLGIIGGTGYYEILESPEKIEIATPFGRALVSAGEIEKKKAFFIARHGEKHSIPPHKVNYRANIYALKLCNVERIISVNSVGSLSLSLKPGEIVLPSDLIDFTKTRAYTFYDTKVMHIDFSEPFCSELRSLISKAAKEQRIEVKKRAVYAVTEGPRFETKAEIRMLKKLGASIVGMVASPEAALAKELEMCYASIANITNFACGISKSKLTVSEVKKIAEENREKIIKIIRNLAKTLPEERKCRCKEALKDAEV